MSGYAAQDVYVPGLDAPNGVETEADVVALLTEAGWDAYVVGDNKLDVITHNDVYQGDIEADEMCALTRSAGACFACIAWDDLHCMCSM